MKIVEDELKMMNRGKEEAVKYVKKEKRVYQLKNILEQVIQLKYQKEMEKLEEELQRLKD